MKVTFEVDTEDDCSEYRGLVHGYDALIALDRIRNYVRNLWKHGELSEGTWKVVDDIYDVINSEYIE